MACTFVKILSTSVCNHQLLETASLFPTCVEAQEPIPTCEEVPLHQRQTPNWRSVSTGANRRELRWLCHLLPIMSVWTPPSVAGLPLCCSWHLSQHHENILWHHPLFPSQLSLCLWSGTVVFFPASPSEADFMPRFLLGSPPLLLSNCSWISGASCDPPVASLVVHCFSLQFSALVKDKGCSSWARNCLPQMDTIAESIPYLQSHVQEFFWEKETLYRWGCAKWQTNGKAEKWKKKTCRTLVMLHGCALLLFLDTVQGTRSELAGHDSANQESCRANKMSEKEHESVWKVQSQMQDGGEKKRLGEWVSCTPPYL